MVKNITVDSLKEMVLQYFNSEYKNTVHYVTAFRDDIRVDTKQTVKCAWDRALGVVMFVQELGVPYEWVADEYEKFKKSFESLLTN